MRKQWQTVKKTKEYQNPYMEIYKHQIIRSDGKKRLYYVLERGIAGNWFAIIIALTSNKETFLVEQFRYPVGVYSWEFPMGHAPGKDFLQVAKKELQEETGIRAREWKKIGFFHTVPGHSSEKAAVYLALDLTFGKSNPSETELLKVRKVKLNRIAEMIKKGEILDGPTIVAYYYLQSYLKKI